MPEVADTRIQVNVKTDDETLVNLYAVDGDEVALVFKGLDETAEKGSEECAAIAKILRSGIGVKAKKAKKSKSKDDDDEDENEEEDDEGEEEGDEDAPSKKDLKLAKQLKVKGYKDMDADELKAAVRKALKRKKSK